MLREFHTAMHVHDGWMPAFPTPYIPEATRRSRQDLLAEELYELELAEDERDIVKIADGIADAIYVLAGTAVTYGIPLDAVLTAVHFSNMTKTNIPGEPKLVKGPDYRKPRIAEALGLEEAAK
jgi:predicted HAD superfamily Cof-like phosphohydrolase